MEITSFTPEEYFLEVQIGVRQIHTGKVDFLFITLPSGIHRLYKHVSSDVFTKYKEKKLKNKMEIEIIRKSNFVCKNK